jgi:serine/threonine-protein kinase BUR1
VGCRVSLRRPLLPDNWVLIPCSCVFGEMLVGKSILAGESDAHQLEIIWDLMGSPTEETMPGWKSLPGGEHLATRSRSGNLQNRFRE